MGLKMLKARVEKSFQGVCLHFYDLHNGDQSKNTVLSVSLKGWDSPASLASNGLKHTKMICGWWVHKKNNTKATTEEIYEFLAIPEIKVFIEANNIEIEGITKMATPKKVFKTVLGIPYGSIINTNQRKAIYVADVSLYETGKLFPLAVGKETPDTEPWNKLNAGYYGEHGLTGFQKVDFKLFPFEIGNMRILNNEREVFKSACTKEETAQFAKENSQLFKARETFFRKKKQENEIIEDDDGFQFIESDFSFSFAIKAKQQPKQFDVVSNSVVLSSEVYDISKHKNKAKFEDVGFFKLKLSNEEEIIVAVKNTFKALHPTEKVLNYQDTVELNKIIPLTTENLAGLNINKAIFKLNPKVSILIEHLSKLSKGWVTLNNVNPQEKINFAVLVSDSLKPKYATLYRNAGLVFEKEGESWNFFPEIDFIKKENLRDCSKCGELNNEDSLKDVNGRNICLSCCEKMKWTCELCKKEHYDDRQKLFYNDAEHFACDRCLSRGSFQSCEECVIDKVVYHPSGAVCKFFAAKIQNYSWQPEKMTLIGSCRTLPFRLGVELEIGTNKPRELCRKIVEMHPGAFYFKRDGSVDGVEVVSMPMSLSKWREIDVSKFNDPSFKTRTEGYCGIHVHIDRSAFTDAQIRLILGILWYEREKTYRVAGRRESSYAQIINPENYTRTKDLATYVGGNKYDAINMRHSKTFEYRIFDATLDHLKFQKNVDFVSALWKFTKDGNCVDTTWKEFRKFLNAEKRIFAPLNTFCEKERI